MEELLIDLNNAKEIVLDRLLHDGVITEEQYDTYIAEWNIIVVSPNIFKRWMDKFNITKGIKMKYVKFEK